MAGESGSFLTSQSLSLDRFRLQPIGLRTRQFNLQPGGGGGGGGNKKHTKKEKKRKKARKKERKKKSTAKFGGTEKWKKFLQEGKHSTKLEKSLS